MFPPSCVEETFLADICNCSLFLVVLAGAGMWVCWDWGCWTWTATACQICKSWQLSRRSSPDSPQLLGCIRPEESLYQVYCSMVLCAHCVEQALTSTLGLLAPPFSKDSRASDQRCLFPKLSKWKIILSACKGVGETGLRCHLHCYFSRLHVM